MKLQVKFLLIFLFCDIFLQFGTDVARAYYDPQSGRWLSRDPLEDLNRSRKVRLVEYHFFTESGNLYFPFHNDAINRIDRLGLCACEVFGSGINIRAPQDSRINAPDTARLRVEMTADYYKNPQCCHFRRWVKGHFNVNGQAPGVFLSGSGQPVTDSTYVTDGPDDADNTNWTDYGYSGIDFPGFDSTQGSDNVDYYVEFKFQVIDSCNNNRVVVEREGPAVSIQGTRENGPRRIDTSNFDE